MGESVVDHPDEAIATARRMAQDAWNAVGVAARDGADRASAVLAATDDPHARSVAHRALALAWVELGDTRECMANMLESERCARIDGDPELIALAETGVAAAHGYAGDRARSLRKARAAVRRAPAVPRIWLSLGVILERYGMLSEALDAYGRAELLALRAADAHALVRVHCNRGVLQIYRAELGAARNDLDRALDLARELGQSHLEVGVRTNLAFLATREGRIVEALAGLDEVARWSARYGGLRLGTHELDRSEALLLAGLHADAAKAALAAAEAFESAGAVLEAAEASTAVAQAALLTGDLELAARAAEAALARLTDGGVGPWVALAEDVAVRTAWARGVRTPALARRAAAVAAALDEAGWTTSAASARVLAARIELQLGRREQAAAQLRLVRDTPRSPVGLRIQARTATAWLRREAGDGRGARAALRSGWALLERHRATLGAIELRAGATAHGAEIVGIGLEIAIEDGRPREVLAWAERGRVGALTPRATAPPDDPELARLLGELRVVAGEADAAAKRGEPSGMLLRRQAQIEERVRGRARLLPPEEGGAATPALDPADLLAALGDRALLEYVVSGDDLWVVVGVRGRFTLRHACSVAQIADEADGLRVALRRLAFGSPVPQLRTAARQGVGYARGRLQQLLLDPVRDLIGDRPRVIVPMGVLHAVPWSALHEPGDRYVVAPSASLWARAASAPQLSGRALLVAGPRLAEASAEVAAVQATFDDGGPATVLEGSEATVDAVRQAMGDAALAHLACHGHFRADNPLFSSLELHDGALSVFELERLGRTPGRIILSACDAGLSAVHPGDELLGLAAALLRLGTTGIVASVLPVPDAATRRLMGALHQQLAAGAGLADALGAARATLDPSEDDDLVASSAFQVLGAG